MRKYILILVLIILTVFCFTIMFFGFKIGNFKINSYSEIESVSVEKNNLLSELNYKNSTEFNAKKSALDSAVKEYNNKKTQYDELVQKGQISDNVYNSMDLYDVDFLLTVVGNYATEKGVTLQFDIYKSLASTSMSPEYVICDLNFTITGDYIAITDFIYSLEDDDKLGFEIRDFFIEKGGENLQSTFVVKDVPINRKNLSSVPTMSTSVYNEVSNSEN